MLSAAWENVTIEPIKNCYRKVGFVDELLHVNEISDDNSEDDSIFTVERSVPMEEFGGVNMVDYIDIDSNLQTAPPRVFIEASTNAMPDV